jgi:hypothetical protein
LHTPVTLIIFNRPETTEQVFAEIAKARPQKLFVVADGPRDGHPDDAERCAAARAVIERVDWECEVQKNYSDFNLGCGQRPATGISWVFEHVDRAIILEDDCLPNQSFFRFCEELIERYRDDERIMQISGNNFQFGKKHTDYSYYFSKYAFCWGWATWRRAWKYHDMELKLWPRLKDSKFLFDIVENQMAVNYWTDKFDRANKSGGEITFWDYQWTFACFTQSRLSVVPNETLISNIGCGPDGTHTKNPNSKLSNLPIREITFPLKHPPCIIRNYEADRFFIENVVVPRTYKRNSKLVSKLRRKISSILINLIKR